MSKHSLRPGLTLGLYPQKQETWPGFLESQARLISAKASYMMKRPLYSRNYIVKNVNQHEQALKKLSDQQMSAHIDELRKNLHRYGLLNNLVALSFATIREVSHRTLDKRHFDVQLLGGWIMMNGMIAEMETGQGKTLTATLPSCTAAWAGIPVHIVTANDYLAERDEQILRPLYRQLGISSASIVDGMDSEPRKKAYQCSIVHSTSQQITFDYLRDRIEMGDDIGKLQIQFKHLQSQHQNKHSAFLLRGLCYTIIDEADSLLIDEAKTPLIISQTRASEEPNQVYYDAHYLANSLNQNTDYIVDFQHHDVNLTQQGKNKLKEITVTIGKYWQNRRHREVMVTLALKATHLYLKDKDYLVREDKIEIIDALTGRVMPDRSWEHGLHQLIEAKENCEITGERDPLARIGYQKFFRRYLRLAGMSGTVTEVSEELETVYGLRVIKIPTHRPSRRKMKKEQVFKTKEQKWRAFIIKVKQIHQQGRPILIGTHSVSASKTVSALLTENGLNHRVLNAQQDQQEAEIISAAGQLNAITVSTNMAGRGTDIALGDGVEDIGGLHVIATERNDARRIDRQLYGRCARQGDPGSTEAFMSLQDESIAAFYPAAVLRVLGSFCFKDKPLPSWLGNIILSLPQKWTEHTHAQLRKNLIKQDRQQSKTLSFTGKME